MALTEKEESLCQAYLVTDDKSGALRKSKYKTDGWKPESVNRKAKELFDKVKIQSRVAELIEQRSKRTEIDADYVLNRHKEIDQLDIFDILTDDLRGLRPLSEWPKSWRTSLNGFDVSELFEYMDGEKELTGFLKKIKMPDKLKNLELLGKHVQVNACKEQVGVQADLDEVITRVFHVVE